MSEDECNIKGIKGLSWRLPFSVFIDLFFLSIVHERQALKSVPCHRSSQIPAVFIIKALKACLGYKHSHTGGDRKKKVHTVNKMDHILQDGII